MTFGEVLNLFTLFVAIAAIGFNVVTLLIVAWQARLAKQTLDATREVVREDRKFRQLDNLTSVGWIITVNGSLERWLEDLRRKRRILQLALDRDELGRVKEVAYGGSVTPHELIYELSYENMPVWLQALWEAGAQHFYNADCSGLLRHLWDDEKQAARQTFVPSVCQRLDESIYYLDELHSYIRDIVPESYLEAPASIDEREFRKPYTDDDWKRRDNQNKARDAH